MFNISVLALKRDLAFIFKAGVFNISVLGLKRDVGPKPPTPPTPAKTRVY